jgi:hypothetical protein
MTDPITMEGAAEGFREEGEMAVVATRIEPFIEILR